MHAQSITGHIRGYFYTLNAGRQARLEAGAFTPWLDMGLGGSWLAPIKH